MNWSGYEWITQERWGNIHPGKSFCWYDPSAVEIDERGLLHLKTHRNPKYFEDLNVVSKIGVGLVSCLTPFTYGSFEIECMLPTGKNLWPAFWMYSFDSWPPEIDVFEAYSNNKSNYCDFEIKNTLKFWNVKSCLHYGSQENHKHIKDEKHFFTFKNPAKNFIKYRCDWYPNKIEIFYNDKKVRVIEDGEILNQLKGKYMNVIINNSINFNYDLSDTSISDFVVRYFKYTKFDISI